MAQLIPTRKFEQEYLLEPQVEAIDSINNLLILMGVPINNLSMDETLERIERMVLEGRQLEKTHQVATVNVDFLVKAMDDIELHNMLQNADLCTADGMPLVWSSKLIGVPLKERVTGSDMVPQLAKRAAESGLSLYFMGGSEHSAEKAKEILTTQYPDLNVVGTSCPYWKPGEEFDETVLDHIRQTDPDILLVALGNPKQEMWIKEYGEVVGVPVMIGVGASLDFIASNVKRAPVWMQKIGLEWLGRLLQEPGRLWKRYWTDATRFLPWMATQWIKSLQKPEESPELLVTANRISDVVVVNLLGKLDATNSHGILEAVKQSMLKGTIVTINFAEITSIDSGSLGTLIEVKKLVERNNGRLRLVGMTQMVAGSLSVAKLFSYFNITDQNLVFGLKNP